MNDHQYTGAKTTNMEEVVKLSWADEANGIMLMEFPVEWTADDFVDVIVRGYDFIEQSGRAVCTVLDFTRTEKIPRNIIARYTEIGRNVHPDNPLIVLVIHTSLMEQLAGIFSRAIRHLKIARTRQEAMQMIYAFYDAGEEQDA